jgi:hypothetical protein
VSPSLRNPRLTAFPDSDTFPLEYAEFSARHGKESVEGDVGMITLALPAQVAEIKKLLDLVKVTEAEIEKGLR